MRSLGGITLLRGRPSILLPPKLFLPPRHPQFRLADEMVNTNSSRGVMDEQRQFQDGGIKVKYIRLHFPSMDDLSVLHASSGCSFADKARSQ